MDLQALHRLRERLVHNRTRLINQARGLLMERGVRIGSGRHVFQKALAKLADRTESDLSGRMLEMFEAMTAELAVINEQAAGPDAKIKSIARKDDDMCRLMEITGVGPTIATALIAAIGGGECFGKGRDLAACLGLVPRQITTGGKAKLIGISKPCNGYLRKLFIHGARTVLHLVKDRNAPITKWVDGLKERAHVNVAAVAMASVVTW